MRIWPRHHQIVTDDVQMQHALETSNGKDATSLTSQFCWLPKKCGSRGRVLLVAVSLFAGGMLLFAFGLFVLCLHPDAVQMIESVSQPAPTSEPKLHLHPDAALPLQFCLSELAASGLAANGLSYPQLSVHGGAIHKGVDSLIGKTVVQWDGPICILAGGTCLGATWARWSQTICTTSSAPLDTLCFEVNDHHRLLSSGCCTKCTGMGTHEIALSGGCTLSLTLSNMPPSPPPSIPPRPPQPPSPPNPPPPPPQPPLPQHPPSIPPQPPALPPASPPAFLSQLSSWLPAAYASKTNLLKSGLASLH